MATPLELYKEKNMDRFSEFVPHCEHAFLGGLCTSCLCPATPADDQRAANAIDNAQALMGHYSEVLKRFLTRDDAICEAWRSHQKGA